MFELHPSNINRQLSYEALPVIGVRYVWFYRGWGGHMGHIYRHPVLSDKNESPLQLGVVESLASLIR